MPYQLTRKPALVAAVLWLFAGVAYFVLEAVTASAFKGYSYATNYISDLGVPDVGSLQGRAIDSPLHVVMNVAFIGQGILFFGAALFITRAATERPRKTFLALAAVHAVGFLLVGAFPASRANVDSGLAVFHVGGAVLGIFAGNVAAIVAGRASGRFGAPRAYTIASVVIGIVGVLSNVMLPIDAGLTTINILPDGIWERGAVDAIMVWEILTGIVLLAALRRPAQGEAAPLRP